MSARPCVIALLCALLCGVASAMKVGDTATDFSRVALDGKPVRLAELRGKLVLLNFWATWCAPCREEMPALSKWQETYGRQGLRVIGVSMDDDAAAVREFLRQHPVAYPIVMGDARLAEQLGGVLGLPLSYVIDAQGRVIARHQGLVDLPKMQARIRAWLDVPRRAP